MAPLDLFAADENLDAVAKRGVAPDGGANPPTREGRGGDERRLIKIRVLKI